MEQLSAVIERTARPPRDAKPPARTFPPEAQRELAALLRTPHGVVSTRGLEELLALPESFNESPRKVAARKRQRLAEVREALQTAARALRSLDEPTRREVEGVPGPGGDWRGSLVSRLNEVSAMLKRAQPPARSGAGQPPDLRALAIANRVAGMVMATGQPLTLDAHGPFLRVLTLCAEALHIDSESANWARNNGRKVLALWKPLLNALRQSRAPRKADK